MTVKTTIPKIKKPETQNKTNLHKPIFSSFASQPVFLFEKEEKSDLLDQKSLDLKFHHTLLLCIVFKQI